MQTENTFTSRTLVAVPEALREAAGAVVYWSLSGLTKLDELTALWAAAQLDSALLPTAPTPDAALKRALQERTDQRMLLRPLKKGDGWRLVEEQVTGTALTHSPSVRAYIDTDSRPAFEPASWEYATAVYEDWERSLGELSTIDISYWLISLAGYCRAVTLRGGLYFIPRQYLGEWQRMMEVVAGATGHAISEIPAMEAEKTVAAVLSALTAEAEKEASSIEEDMLKEMADRSIDRRIASAQAMGDKIAFYENLLGGSLADMSARLERIKSALALSRLTAEA